MRVLIVENSKTMSSLIKHNLSQIEGLVFDYAQNMESLTQKIDQNGFDYYDLAVSGIYLDGCKMGEVVEYLTEYQIPTIVFSGEYSEENRNRFINMPGVVDYVIKENQTAMRYMCHMVYRFQANRHIKTLVVSEKKAVRLHVSGLLQQYAFKVFQAESGEQAVEILKKNRDIKLVVTGQDIGKVSGLDLTKKIRETYLREEMAIIGMAPQNSNTLSAKFIKYGANDFLITPFQPEEFQCRISMNIDMIENAKIMFDMASKDFLTGLLNRRYFFQTAQGKLKRASREQSNVCLAMVDIDFFKSVNDTFGHDVGDEVLKTVASIIKDNSRPADVVARIGGEEFCIMLDGMNEHEINAHFEKMRLAIQSCKFDALGERQNVTASFGVIQTIAKQDLNSLMTQADSLLYNSKHTGRNKVTLQSIDLLKAS